MYLALFDRYFMLSAPFRNLKMIAFFLIGPYMFMCICVSCQHVYFAYDDASMLKKKGWFECQHVLYIYVYFLLYALFMYSKGASVSFNLIDWPKHAL